MKHFLFFFAAMLLSSAAVSAQSGTTGTLTWSLSDDSTLTIRGEGDMPDYDLGKSPWYDYRKKIRTAVIEPDVTGIGKYAFIHCDALTSVRLPNSLKQIGGSAFYYCEKLASVDIPEGVTSIGSRAFAYSDALTSVGLPNSLKQIEHAVFSNCHKLASINIPEGVTVIGTYAFRACYALPSVLLPSSLTEIGSQAFAYCRSLTSVTIPRSVTEIGFGAFDCPISVEEGNTAFSAKSGVLFSRDGSVLIRYPVGITDTHYAISPGTVRIGNAAFSHSDYLETVSIPEGVTSIESSAFAYCSRLKSISIPEGVTSIESSAFAYCRRLESVSIPESVTAIEAYTFEECDSLRSVAIPRGVTKIGVFAFYSCNSLESVSISRSVTKIEASAFSFCSQLTAITVEAGSTSFSSVDGVLFNYDGSTLIRYMSGHTATRYAIPPGTVRIEGYAFHECRNLRSVSIPEGVTIIGYAAFEGCGVTSITIPRSVTSIYSWAFTKCSLRDVTVRWAIPLAIGETVFMDSRSCDTLRVPPGTRALYEAAKVWKDFKYITEEAATGLLPAPSPASLSCTQGILRVHTPGGEQISVYTLGGALLYSARKEAGEAVFRIGHLPRGILIVQGSSGWSSKTVHR
jgi:hypothetical protein